MPGLRLVHRVAAASIGAWCSCETLQIHKKKTELDNLYTLKILAPTSFRARGIDRGCVVDFLGAKLRARIQQQPQAPKPYLDCITLQHAEYNAWISSQYQKVCSCGFARRNIPSMECYEDIDARAGVFVQASSWTSAPLALCSYTSRRRFNFSSTNMVVTKLLSC